MSYEVTDRVARITFNRPEKGNAIIADTPLELSALVERADLDPGVHVILVSGRGEGFCAGFDLSPTPRDRRRGRRQPIQRTPCSPARRRPSTICPISRGTR
jgi:enoyl-CoA hydratase/carnithine racemase